MLIKVLTRIKQKVTFVEKDKETKRIESMKRRNSLDRTIRERKGMFFFVGLLFFFVVVFSSAKLFFQMVLVYYIKL